MFDHPEPDIVGPKVRVAAVVPVRGADDHSVVEERAPAQAATSVSLDFLAIRLGVE
jgi:hypothetical protein